LTFTPESQGDYIILATASLDGSSTRYDFKCRLLVNTTTHSKCNIEPVVAANRYSWETIVRVSLTVASHTIKIQYCSESRSATAGIRNATIIALRADQFENNYYAEENARTTTKSRSYVDKTTLTQPPQAVDHLIIGCAVWMELLSATVLMHS
jgi:hypothetical protein